ncbi:MAG TPA: hypothetical protein DGR79_06550 [Clostridiales bacterium]|nr:hypothetical protein [Clostridiales bacterium]
MPFKHGVDEEWKQRLEGEIERMKSIFPTMGIQKALLFGSAARGDVTESSDIDLILIKDTEARFLDRLEEALAALEPRVDLDVLVYTPEEFEELVRTRPFFERALKEGRVLYEA